MQVIDQASIDILLFNLYTWFHDEIYLKAAHELFADIQSTKERMMGQLNIVPIVQTNSVML